MKILDFLKIFKGKETSPDFKVSLIEQKGTTERELASLRKAVETFNHFQSFILISHDPKTGTQLAPRPQHIEEAINALELMIKGMFIIRKMDNGVKKLAKDTMNELITFRKGSSASNTSKKIKYLTEEEEEIFHYCSKIQSEVDELIEKLNKLKYFLGFCRGGQEPNRHVGADMYNLNKVISSRLNEFGKNLQSLAKLEAATDALFESGPL